MLHANHRSSSHQSAAPAGAPRHHTFIRLAPNAVHMCAWRALARIKQRRESHGRGQRRLCWHARGANARQGRAEGCSLLAVKGGWALLSYSSGAVPTRAALRRCQQPAGPRTYRRRVACKSFQNPWPCSWIGSARRARFVRQPGPHAPCTAGEVRQAGRAWAAAGRRGGQPPRWPATALASSFSASASWVHLQMDRVLPAMVGPRQGTVTASWR